MHGEVIFIDIFSLFFYKSGKNLTYRREATDPPEILCLIMSQMASNNFFKDGLTPDF